MVAAVRRLIHPNEAAAAEVGKGEGAVRRAFRANLSAAVAQRLGERLHPHHRLRLIDALATAHGELRHRIDLRFRLPGLRGGVYVVLQAGFAPKTAHGRAVGPLAAQVLSRTPGEAMEALTADERGELAACVERAEISTRHPFDWRPRLVFRSARLYANLVAGPDRRSRALAASDDRRADQDDAFAAICLATAVFGLALAGAWLIGPALIDAYFAPVEGSNAFISAPSAG
ncbi:MAG: hypothetical protein AAGF90_06840 [Pseudomonadota bacterium]